MLTIGLFALLLVHPVHETVSEVEWNPKSKRMEVSLRLSLLDEQWLQRNAVAPADRKSPVSKWGVSYLQSRFRFLPVPKAKREPTKDQLATRDQSKKANAAHRYHWVGRKEEGAHVWWFFEIQPSDGKPPTTIEQRMFFERNQNYVNRILVLGQVPRNVIETTIKTPQAALKKNANAAAPTIPAN